MGCDRGIKNDQKFSYFMFWAWQTSTQVGLVVRMTVLLGYISVEREYLTRCPWLDDVLHVSPSRRYSLSHQR